MASAYGSTVQHWRARVVTDCTGETATAYTLRVRTYWCSISWGYSVTGCSAYATNGSYTTSGSFTASSGYGASVETLVAERSVTYSKGASAQTITCVGSCTLSGGYHNGTSTATAYHTIPAITYSAPAAPSGCSASRVTDTSATVTWANGATTVTTPRSAVLVERSTDGGAWAQVASLGASATNYADGGISANHRYQWRVRSSGAGGTSAYSTSGTVTTTPAAPTSVTATKTGAQVVQLSIEGEAPYATGWVVMRTADGGATWKGAGTADAFPWSDASAPAGTVRYRVAASYSDASGTVLQSGWTESNSVTTITPPLAPTLSGLPSVAATGSALSVSWAPSHPDGSAQEAAQVGVTVGGSETVYDVSGAVTTFDLPAAATASAGAVSVRVRTKGLHDDWGAWSAAASVTVAVPPSVTVTSPATDGTVVDALPLLVAWEVADATGVSAQTLRLTGEGGEALLTLRLGGDVRELSLDDSVYALGNLASYAVTITVTGGSSLSASARRAFATEWAGPAAPLVTVREGEGLSCEVLVEAGEGDGTEPPAVSFSVTRVTTDGSQWLVADGLEDGQTARDPLPPLNADVSYLVTAYAATGASTQVIVSARVDSSRWSLCFGAGAAERMELSLNPAQSRSVERAGELYHFADGGAGGGLPLFYGLSDVDASMTLGATLDADEADRLAALVADHPVAWVRDPMGHRWRCRVTLSQSWGFGTPIMCDASLSCTEVRWEEASRG